MSNTFVGALDNADVIGMQDELTPQERADWLASIEYDMRNPNRGKELRLIEELWQRLEDSVRKHYEGVLR